MNTIATDVAILGGIIAILVGMAGFARVWWNFATHQTEVAKDVKELTDSVKELIIRKDIDHERITRLIDRVDQRLYDHEKWHIERRKNGDA